MEYLCKCADIYVIMYFSMEMCLVNHSQEYTALVYLETDLMVYYVTSPWNAFHHLLFYYECLRTSTITMADVCENIVLY